MCCEFQRQGKGMNYFLTNLIIQPSLFVQCFLGLLFNGTYSENCFDSQKVSLILL